MNRYRKQVATIIIILAGISVGCNVYGSRGVLNSGAQSYTVQQSEANKKNIDCTQNSGSNQKGETNRYAVAGIENPAEFEAVFKIMQEYVAVNDKKGVANYIIFPITVKIDGIRTKIETKDQFMANYEKIITDQVKEAFILQKINETFVNWKGVMVGRGEVWLIPAPDKAMKYGIYGINN